MAVSGSTFNPATFGKGLGYGGIGAGIAGLLMGNDNPADSAMPYLNQIPDAIKQYYNPYISAGANALPQLQGQYSNLLSNPGGMANKIGSSFQQSPGFQFALQQALKASNQAAAAGGMAGSPQNQFQNMSIATQLGNQDYYNWLNPAMSMYTQGLSGLGGMSGMGLTAGSSLAEQIAQALASKAQLNYAGQTAQNQAQQSDLGSIIGGAGMLAAFA